MAFHPFPPAAGLRANRRAMFRPAPLFPCARAASARMGAVGLVACCLVVLAGCHGIREIRPAEGLPGTVVELRGSGFSPLWHENEVTLGGSRARVVDASSTRLRVVALRDVATGPVVVSTPVRTLTSTTPFTRGGHTLAPTADEPTGAELVEGRAFPQDRRYDMAAKGVGQKILVVLARPNDKDPEANIPDWANGLVGPFANSKEFVQRLVSHPDNGVNRYFLDATGGETSGDFLVTDWMPLSQNWDFYAWGPEDVARAQTSLAGAQADLAAVSADPASTQADIDAAQAVVNAKQAALDQANGAQGFLQQADFAYAEALIGAKAALGDAAFNAFTDHFLVLAGPWMRGSCCWLTTGFHAESTNPALPLGPFDIDFPSPKGGTWMAEDGKPGRMVHELSHFFASGDLYDGSAGAFDMMGFHDELPMYSGYNQHLKGDWLEDGNVVELQWGAASDFDQTFDLVAPLQAESPAGDDVKQVIRLRVTDGLYYFVETRQLPDPAAAAGAKPSFDRQIPGVDAGTMSGVLITKAVESNNQSNNLEPMITLVAPQTSPSPRTLAVGEVFTDPARTIRISVESRTQNRPAVHRVRVQWGHLPAADPNGQFDLRISPWAPPPWESVDIWANSIKNDTTPPPTIVYKNHEPGDTSKPVGNGDPPWVGQDNTLFARISNQGVVETPEPVRVTFYINSPPGVGDNGTWAPFDTVVIPAMTAGETRIIEATRKWRPAAGEHTCIRVLIEPMTGEVTFDNNEAQENFNEFESGAASPYQAVAMEVVARNPYDRPVVMDMVARNVPESWNVAFDQGAVWLPPKGTKTVNAVVWTDRHPSWDPQHDRKRGPRKAMISLEGWVDRPWDRFFPAGGVTAFVQGVRLAELRIDARQKELRQGDKLTLFGRLQPAVAAAPIALHVTGPDGKRVVESTVTDSNGQFVHTLQQPLQQAGPHTVIGYVLPGGEAATTESSPLVIGVL
jgi:hypothetical protein